MQVVYAHNLVISSIVLGKIDSLVVSCENLLTEGQQIVLEPFCSGALLCSSSAIVNIDMIHSVSCSMADELGHYILKVSVVRQLGLSRVRKQNNLKSF